MVTKYTNDRATQILLSLLKSHGIRKVIASPGTTNIALVASMQYDPWFQMYSSVDERSAAYIACGLASESGEPVILTCTEATASRNYFPGLTEAHYRKLPILVITGTHGDAKAGHLHSQSIDRSQAPKDTVNFSVSINPIDKNNEEWLVTDNINKAILALTYNGGGPVHINLHEATDAGYDTETLPAARKISRITYKDTFPSLDNINSIIIFIGSHRQFAVDETALIELFCEQHNAVVFADHTSGYNGRYKVLNALLGCQNDQRLMQHPDLVLHLGEVSGEIYNIWRIYARQTWRVNEDGVIRDLFRNLTCIFQMDELYFFRHYISDDTSRKNTSLYEYFSTTYERLILQFPELPFGNIWLAQQLHSFIPEHSTLHVSIFNSLRSWNFFPLSSTITSNCNVGGFGIDGAVSTLLGAALARPDQLHFAVVGDLAFFYDMNVLGNRHFTPNIRILLINNGIGTEFRNYDHPASRFGADADAYIAAGGHFAQKSPVLVRAYVEALGFTYLTASTKEEFLGQRDLFTTSAPQSHPIIFEVFTTPNNESEAIRLVRSIVRDERTLAEKLHDKASNLVHKIIK